MKKFTIILCLTVVAFISHATGVLAADSYDSETATIQKKSANSAKVCIDKKTFTAPICFADGATWDNVKDHYEVAPSTAAGLESGKLCISVGADGTAKFMKNSCSGSSCSPKKK